MTTLEKLIDALRGIDGPVMLDEAQVRELVVWFETARRSLAEFEVDAWHADIADMGPAELRIRLTESRRAVKSLNDQIDAYLARELELSLTPEQSEEFLRRLDGEEIRKAVEVAVIKERAECHAAVCLVGHDPNEQAETVVRCAQAIEARGRVEPVGPMQKTTIELAVEAEREACARAADSYGAHDVARVIRGWGGK